MMLKDNTFVEHGILEEWMHEALVRFFWGAYHRLCNAHI
jgi:hypothetical protein